MSPKIQEPTLTCQTSGILTGLLILVTFISGGVCQNILLTCPEEFLDGQVQDVLCSVTNTTEVAGCRPFLVTFAYTKESGIVEDLCTTAYPGTCGQKPAGVMTCGCLKVNNGEYTYQLNFLGNKTVYEGRKIFCSLNCLPANNFSKDCASKYGPTSPTNTTELTSSSASTSSTKATPYIEVKDSCSSTCKGLAIGLPVGSFVLAVIVFALFKTKVIRCPQKPSKPAADTTAPLKGNNAERTSAATKEEQKSTN